MKHPAWYPDWQEEAFDELVAKNKRLEDEFRLGHWPRYDYDLTAGKLLFSDNGITKVVAEIQLAGSTSVKPTIGFGHGQIPTCPVAFLKTPSVPAPSERKTGSTN